MTPPKQGLDRSRRPGRQGARQKVGAPRRQAASPPQPRRQGRRDQGGSGQGPRHQGAPSKPPPSRPARRRPPRPQAAPSAVSPPRRRSAAGATASRSPRPRTARHGHAARQAKGAAQDATPEPGQGPGRARMRRDAKFSRGAAPIPQLRAGDLPGAGRRPSRPRPTRSPKSASPVTSSSTRSPGEGGTVTVDRERDLALSAQALPRSRRSTRPSCAITARDLRRLRAVPPADPEAPAPARCPTPGCASPARAGDCRGADRAPNRAARPP